MHRHRLCLRPHGRRAAPLGAHGQDPNAQDHHKIVGQGVSTWAKALIRRNQKKRGEQKGNR